VEAELYSDALDDLRGVDPFAPEPPLVGVLHPMMATMRERVQRHAGLVGPEHGGALDMGFLLVCHELAPERFRDLVEWRTGGKPSTIVESYQYVNGARNALRCTLHQTGVL